MSASLYIIGEFGRKSFISFDALSGPRRSNVSGVVEVGTCSIHGNACENGMSVDIYHPHRVINVNRYAKLLMRLGTLLFLLAEPIVNYDSTLL